MKLFILCCLLLVGCPKVISIPTLNTETKEGDALLGQTLQQTGSRQNVPVNEKPRHVVSQTHIFHSGAIGEIIVTKGIWLWSDSTIYTNCAKCHKDKAVVIKNERPKRPWYYWFVIIGIMSAVIAEAIRRIFSLNPVTIVVKFIKRIFMRP